MSALTTPSGFRKKGHFNQAGIGSNGLGVGDTEKLKSDRLARDTQGHLKVHQLNRQEQEERSEWSEQTKETWKGPYCTEIPFLTLSSVLISRKKTQILLVKASFCDMSV